MLLIHVYVLRYIDISKITVKMGEGKEREREGGKRAARREGKGRSGKKRKEGMMRGREKIMIWEEK